MTEAEQAESKYPRWMEELLSFKGKLTQQILRLGHFDSLV